ncbi:AbrB family transcriptional regulator [Halovulum dunhuangense]|uniref:AbrB family transcriptional regulator n=1 Tax=Halovulum dunhuangense TaxID=1505036 RepID=A0A849L1N0_9RHOB|nr:AbrB family transcriptional regulator [Halovulum dunhuangense]NNU80165.1 AbrB family transcriptional regulator [Halovulum dunhuangense]
MSATRDSKGAAPAPWWRDPTWWSRAALTYAVALAGGTAASRAGIPLPWMLGPFFACGVFAAAGARLAAVPMSRELGQLAVGLAVGLRFTPATLVATLALFPAMLAATIYVMVYTFIAALIFRPLAAVDKTTAFFATAAGGVADMAIIARQKGGETSAVAMVHALRVSTTVAIIPLVVIAFGAPGTQPDAPPVDGAGLIWLALALVGSVGVVKLLQRTVLPNPWLVGPMFLGIALGASGLLRLTVPPLLIIAAQLAIGAWLGTRFERRALMALPRVAASGVVVSLFMVAAAGLGAFAMASLTEVPVTTSFLALAPAAVTEMAITAKVMHLDAEVVTAFHVMRIFLVCSTILVVFRIYNKLTGGADGSRL